MIVIETDDDHVATFADGSQVWVQSRVDGTVWVASRGYAWSTWGPQVQAAPDIGTGRETTPVCCARCGTHVADRQLHDAWHDVLDAQAAVLDTTTAGVAGLVALLPPDAELLIPGGE